LVAGAPQGLDGRMGRLLSLGAGVQSTTLLILAARGDLEPLDGAVFADTGWEPAAVYRHLDRIEREIAIPAGIPIHRVSVGNIRDDALDPAHRFASMAAAHPAR
jgi:3'-phosphoadenosine 5'-phosphosulfate sulfotransferase (PAPS reductase)/FAD synthetase